MRRTPDFLRDFGWKLGAVVLAYAFWLAAIEEPLAIRQLDISVNFDNLGPTLAIVRDRPSTIVVNVQAPETIARDLQPSDVRVRVDLGGLGRGRHRISLAPNGPSVMPRRFGVKVMEVFPPSLELTLEPRLATEVPVHANLTGVPAEGFSVQEVIVKPATVRIEGPESAVKAITEARTREVSLAGHSAPFEQTVWADVAGADVRIVGEPRVSVEARITETMGEKTFSEVPVALLNAPGTVRATPRVVRLSVRGPQRVLAQLKREDLLAFVDLKSFVARAEEYHPPVRIDFTRDLFRDRLSAQASTPPSIAVRIARTHGSSRLGPGR